MEALQLSRPNSSELSPKPTIRSSVSYERVKNRLKKISRTPSSIIVPSPSPKPEPAESFSTVTSATTATEPASEISTAATSVLSLPPIFRVQKLYVSPSTPMDEKIKDVWTRQIKSRLSAALLYSIPTGTCVQEVMMVGKRPDALKPTLVITCGDAVTKKRVEKTFKSQGWLQELLEAKNIMFVTLVAKTLLSAGPASNDGSTERLSESYAIQCLPPGVSTSCGLGLLINSVDSRLPQHCTLGGLLVVNGEILGMTAGHPFLKIRDNVIKREPLEMAQAVEDSSDEESGTTSSEPFVFNDDDDGDANDDLTASTVSLGENADVASTPVDGPPHGQYKASRPLSPSMKWYLPQAALLPVSTPREVSSIEDPLNDHDWALLEMLPPAVISRPNKISHIDLHHDILIERTVSGPACGEVTITIADIGLQSGYLHSSPATMKVGESVLDVQLITLESTLPLGSSGAWVILEDKLCGYIVAIRQDIPWAYMVAIEPTLEDIGRKLKTDDVRLPTAVEIESLRVSSKASEVEILKELKEETRASTSEASQVSISGDNLKKVWKAQDGSTRRNSAGLSGPPIERYLRPYELPSSPAERHLPRELPLTTDKYLPAEFPVPDGLVQQEDESLDEKSSMLGDAPHTSMSQPSVPPGEGLRGNSESRESTIGRVARIPLATIQSYPTQPTVSLHFIDTSTRSTITTPIEPSTYLTRQTRQWKSTRAIPQTLRALSLHMIRLPYKTWRRLETLILRTEYRRRQPGRYRSPLGLVSILSNPEHPFDDCYHAPIPLLKNTQVFWYYLRFSFVISGNVLLNILYFVFCFPFILWVAHRHRDVLADAKTLARQQYESIEMLGQLPLRYSDHRLLKQYKQYRQTRDELSW